MNIDKNLQLLISNDEWQHLLLKSQHNNLVDVRLDDNLRTFSNKYNNKYIVKIADKFIKDKHIMLLFPNHPTENKRILYTHDYSKIYKLQSEINERINKSFNGETVKLAIVYKDKIYRINDITGTLYVVWSERINCETVNRFQNKIAEYIPVIIEMTGEMKVRNVIPLIDEFIETEYGKQNLYPIAVPHTTLLIPTDVVVFPCEIDPRNNSKTHIKTISNNHADIITKDPVVRSVMQGLSGEEPPFSKNDEKDEDSILVASSDFEFDVDSDLLTQNTPRVHIK